MPADPYLADSGVCQFAAAAALIGLGIDRGHWTATPADTTDPASGALVLTGRSGPAKVYFAATAQAAIRLGTNGLVADNDDVVTIHSHENPPAMQPHPSRAPGRVALPSVRAATTEDPFTAYTKVEE